jgi:hypothetical protein
MRLASVAVLVLSPAVAAAAPDPALPLALAVNLPFGWQDATSVAGSAYVGVTDHDAVRINVASYRNLDNGDAIGEILFHGDGDESIRTGRTTDVGVAWTSYSHALWSGFTYELGVVRRAKSIRTDDDNATPESTATTTTTYAARAHVGWSWLFGRHVFVAAAVGISLGYERGTETTIADLLMPSPVAHDVSRSAMSAEGYLRIGVAR